VIKLENVLKSTLSRWKR